MPEPKSTPVAFRFQPATKETLRTIAQREGRSMANMVEWLVRDYCEREGLGWPLATPAKKTTTKHRPKT